MSMRYTIQVIPQEYTVEAECADHAMIAVASYTGNNNIRLKSRQNPETDQNMRLRNLIDLDDSKQEYIQSTLKNDQEKLTVAVNSVKNKPQRKLRS